MLFEKEHRRQLLAKLVLRLSGQLIVPVCLHFAYDDPRPAGPVFQEPQITAAATELEEQQKYLYPVTFFKKSFPAGSRTWKDYRCSRKKWIEGARPSIFWGASLELIS